MNSGSRLRTVLIFAAAVVAIHLVTIWAAPRLIMQVVMNGPSAHALNMQNQAAFSEPITAASRAVEIGRASCRERV